MERLIEFSRSIMISFEFLLLLLGLAIYLTFSEDISTLVKDMSFQESNVQYFAMLPIGLCGWSFVSGRKLLFPEKDKFNILYEWADFWKLRSIFNASLTWSVIFSIVAMPAIFANWKQPTALGVICLVVSILGAAICSLSVYNAQNTVEVALATFTPNKSP